MRKATPFRIPFDLPFGKGNRILDPNSKPILHARKTVNSMETMKSGYSTCIGPSMYPTLRPGDGIELYTYKTTSEIKVGDVIVYPHPNGATDVLHRVIRILPDGVITRGDNNNKIDPYRIRFDAIIGKVIAAKRRTRHIAVRGGRAGYLTHKLMLFRKYVGPRALLPFRLVSNLTAASGLFHIFHSALDLRIIRIEKNRKSVRILVSGNRPIGRQMAGSSEWRIRFPYKLFVDKRRLEKAATNPS